MMASSRAGSLTGDLCCTQIVSPKTTHCGSLLAIAIVQTTSIRLKRRGLSCHCLPGWRTPATGPTINGVNLYQARASAAGATLVNAARRGRAGAYDSGDLNQYSSSPSGLLNLSYRVTDDLLTYATLTTLWTAANGGYEGLLGAPRTLGVTGRYDF